MRRLQPPSRTPWRGFIAGATDPVTYLRAILRGILGGLLVFAVLAPRDTGRLIAQALPKPNICAISAVVDGDSLTITCPNSGTERARLFGVDAPEMHGRCAQESRAAIAARSALRQMIDKRRLPVIRLGVDKYDRRLVRVIVNGTSVAQSLINAGHARPYDGGARQGWCG